MRPLIQREGVMEEIKAKLIAGGVRNLNEYGYPNCNKENIITDEIYKAFFSSMLKQNKGRKDIDEAIDSLLAQIEG
jgi:hypothetical protein